jgi:stage III sporulation protein AB
MVIRWLGAVLIALSGMALGRYYTNAQKYRLQELTEFKKALLILASEIDYMQTALPEAAARIAQKTSGMINALFFDFAESLTQNNHETAYHTWCQALDKHKGGAHLCNEDWAHLDDFGKTLGYLDKKMQLNAIKLAVEQADIKISALQAGMEKNKGLYQNLGLLGGLLLAVVLW